MEVLNKTIVIDKKVGKETTQVLIEGDIIVPDTKPDIDMVLEANANAYIDNKEITNDKIIFKGNLDINILFIAKSDNKAIYNMSSSYPINDFINMDGVDKNMVVFANCNITNLDYKLINDRKVSFRAILEVNSEVLAKEEIEIVSSIDGLLDNQMKKNNITINKLVSTKFDRFNIKEEIEITGGRPNIKEILDTSLSIVNKDIKISSDKLSISGDIKVCTLYKSDEDDTMITYFEQDVAFSGNIEVNGIEDGMLPEVYLDINEKNIQILEDIDGENRKIGIDAYIGCNIKVSSEEDIEILEDAYSLNENINIGRAFKSYPMLVCKNKNQANIKDIVRLEEDCPPILQLVKVSGKAFLDNAELMEDKVLAEGIIECKILYIANDDEYPMYCFRAILPYSQVIETKGATNLKSNLDLKLALEHISVNMVSDKDLEIRGAINFDTLVTKEKEIGLVTEVEFEELDIEKLNSIASMVMYVMQKDDTLWDLAKMFNTTIDDIMELNEIEKEEDIRLGDKILILKKVC